MKDARLAVQHAEHSTTQRGALVFAATFSLADLTGG